MILNNCRLIPELSGGIKSDAGSVRIEKGKIDSVSEKAACMSQAIDEEVCVDCKGMTLLPGLIDLHTHISVLGGYGAGKTHTEMGLLTEVAEHATHYLDHGFTTIRDCGSMNRVANYVRELVRSGTVIAPDIISCGLGLMATELEENHPLSHHLSFADGEAELTKAVRRESAQGADFIKIFASGAAADPSGVPTQAIMYEEEIGSIVRAASVKGKYVAAHCHSDEAIRLCAENGVHTVEHGTYMSDETLEIIRQKDNCYLVPTLAAMYVNEGPMKEFWINRLRPMFEHCTAAMRKAYLAGERLGFGTDCTAGDYCYENGIEFKYRKENCGMNNIDILLQATRINAEIAGIGDEVGEIKPGLKANLILVDGNPDADMTTMYKRPFKVWKDGIVV